MACQTNLSMTELQQISRVDNQILSPQSGKAIIQPIMDNVLGTFLMTEPNNVLSHSIKKALFPILNGGRTLYSINDKITGFDVLSNEFPFMRNSMLKSDITHAIKKMYRTKGVNVCVDFLNRIQTITNVYLKLTGYSIGYDDIRISHDIYKFKNQKIKEAEDGVNKYLEEIYDKKIKTTKEEVELKVFNDLNRTRDEIGKMIMNNIDKNNSFYRIIKSKSKGNILNISQILGSISQQNIQWKKKNGRVPMIVNNRTLPHYTQFDSSPEARGFIRSSYVEGLGVNEFFFHSQSGRAGVIDTACKTADVGYLHRKLIKAVENLQIAYDLTVRNELNRIVQFAYGVENVQPIYITPTSLKLEPIKNYFWKQSEIEALFENNYDVSLLKKEFEELVEIENLSDCKFNKCFDIDSLIPVSDLEYDELVHPDYVIEQTDMLQDKMGLYAYKKFPFDEIERYNLRFRRLLLRYHLASKKVVTVYRLGRDQFDELVRDILLKFYQTQVQPGFACGIIGSQSIGEPATQLSVAANTKIVVNGQIKIIGQMIDYYMSEFKENVIRTHITEDGKESHILPAHNLGLNVPGINMKTGKFQKGRVSELSRHPVNGKMVRITTRSGKSVVTTLSHSLVRKRLDGVIETIRGDKIRVGDFIPVIY